MKETEAMKSRGFKFFICSQCGKQYPAREANPKEKCLICLQGGWHSESKKEEREMKHKRGEEKYFEPGTVARCNRCDEKFSLKEKKPGICEGAAYRLVGGLLTADCGHYDAHWVYVSDLKEEKTYREKTEEIMEAIRAGKELFVETYLGKLKVNGIDPDGSWAYTGSGFSARSWAICSVEIDGWMEQISKGV